MASCRRVVLIDDDEHICELITATGRTLGIECVACTNADAFYNEVSQETGLILLDLHMPQTDGVEVLRGLAARQSRVRIVLMSGADDRVFATTEALAKSLNLNVVGRLQKPFRVAELQSVLTISLRQPVASSTLSSPRVHAIPDEDFAAALTAKQLVVNYQPQVSLSNGKIAGVEALVRWAHPVHGLVFPESFISRFEGLGLIDQLGAIVFEQALNDLTALRVAAGSSIGISLNISVHSLLDLKLPDQLESIAKKCGIDVKSVTIEVPESALARTITRVKEVLEQLQRKGFSLSIDNFGANSGMMRNLKLIPAAEVKIDRAIVEMMVADQAERALVQRGIEGGHALGMRVVAEGIETEEQKEIILAQGCDVAQGYLFSRPLPLDQMLLWLHQTRQSAP